MSRKLKVLLLFDTDRGKPRGYDYAEELQEKSWNAEASAVEALRGLGHEVSLLGICNETPPLLEELQVSRPDVVFHMVEQFQGDPSRDAHVVSFLELLGIPYTGAPPVGLRLCKDKALTKMLLTYHGIPNSRFQVFRQGRVVKRDSSLSFPLLIKPLIEDASYGISQASWVKDDAGLEERVQFLHSRDHEYVIAEEYIDGRELYVSVLGNERLRVLPPREILFGKMPEDGPRIATYKVKWDEEYRRKWGIDYVFAEGLEEAVLKRIEENCRSAYRTLNLKGYARIDMRLTAEGEPMVLEVNPNPDIARDEDFALSAQKAGIPYDRLIQSILDLALSASPEAGE